MDKDTLEIIDHAHAVVMWTLRYIKAKELQITDDELSVLKFHIRRINSVLEETVHPLQTDPIVEFLATGKGIAKPLGRKRKGHLMLVIILLALTIPHYTVQASSPNEMLHAPKVHVPNADVTLPGKEWVIWTCYRW